jgi:hypothetical protein
VRACVRACVQVYRVSALFEAVASNQEKAAKLLIQRGADVNLANSDGTAPLMEAAALGSLSLLRLLLYAAAPPHYPSPLPLPLSHCPSSPSDHPYYNLCGSRADFPFSQRSPHGWPWRGYPGRGV